MSPLPVRQMQHFSRSLFANRGVRASLVVGVALAAQGCGFQLQGAGTLPAAMTRTFVDTDRPHSEFLTTLTGVLKQRGAEVLTAPAEGAAVLDISVDETGQRVLSVSSRNIPREYEVYYAVTFSLRVGTESLISNESLVVTRAYTYDETQVLAKAAEEEILRQALAEDLARRVMQRIQALGATAAVPRPIARVVSASPAPAEPATVVALAALDRAEIAALLDAYGARLVTVRAGDAIPGSYWGDSEAGLIGNAVYVRADTAAHSFLHELSHYVCMTSERRAALATDAGGDDAEEAGVCYLQVLLADRLRDFGAARCLSRHGRVGLQLS